MKVVVNTVLLQFGVLFIFGEFNAWAAETPHDHEVEYKHKTIKLWVDNTGRVTRATFPGSFDPYTGNYYLTNNYLIRLVEEDGFRFVAYIKENKQLLGVRAPVDRDPFRGPEPTDTIWHIVYGGRYFRLRVDPITELEMDITLVPQNLPRHGLSGRRAIVAGIEFYVFRNNERRIVAGLLYPR